MSPAPIDMSPAPYCLPTGIPFTVCTADCCIASTENERIYQLQSAAEQSQMEESDEDEEDEAEDDGEENESGE